MPRIEGNGARQSRFEEALHAFDVRTAEALVRDALATGLAPAQVCSQVIAPALSHIGARSAAGETTPGDEHLAIGVVLRALDVVAEAAHGGSAELRAIDPDV